MDEERFIREVTEILKHYLTSNAQVYACREEIKNILDMIFCDDRK